MNTSTAHASPHPEDVVLKLRRAFRASRERVFRAFTDPALLARGWGPAGGNSPNPQVDLRVGGRYQLDIHTGSGDVHPLSGAYREIDPPNKLVFTWQWGGADPDPETLVTLEFVDNDGHTELLLTHEGFPSQARRDLHNQGWSSCFDCLEPIL